MSSATIASRNGSPATTSEGQIAFQLAAGPGTSAKAGLLGQLAELVGGEGVDRGLELDPLFAIGLQAEAGRALPAVAETYGQRIAGAQIAAADPDEQRVGVGADVEPVEPDFELGAVARLDRGEVRRRRLVELRLAHVGGGSPRDLHHAGVVDAEGARRIGQGQLGMRAGHERARRRERDRAHVLGKIGRERHDGSQCLR